MHLREIYRQIYQHLFTVPNKEFLWDFIGKNREYNKKKMEVTLQNWSNPKKWK